MSPILAFSLMAAKTWFFVVVVFGQVVYERGPMTEDICHTWKQDVIARMEEFEKSGQVRYFHGKKVRRPDVSVDCKQR